MNCTETQKLLDDYLDEGLSADEQDAIEIHVAGCTSCHQLVDESKAIRHALRSLPVTEASPDFEEKVFAEVRSHYGSHTEQAGTGQVGTDRVSTEQTSAAKPGNRFLAGFSTAIAASLALWFASTMYEPQFDDASPQVINLAMSQVKTVRLMFDAPDDLDDVTLSVVLPENIELEGYAGQKQLVWQTKLTKGQNILALPVTAINHGQGELVARLTYGDKTKQFQIVVKTDSDGALIYQINPFKSA
jgi:hypothetical protein